MTSQIPRQPEPQVMDVQDEADAYALADFSQVNEAFVQRLEDLAGHLEDALCVDLGCGPADIPIRLALRRPTWRIIAMDASEPMLQWARQGAREAGVLNRLELRCADACTYQPGEDCDVVFSNSILHHVDDPIAFWRQLARWGRKDAVILVRDLFRPPSCREAQEIVRREASGESDLLQQEFYRSLLAAYTPAEIRSQLDEAGLRHLNVCTVTDRHVDVWGSLRV
jgi:SAM-dependent methyltransferase